MTSLPLSIWSSAAIGAIVLITLAPGVRATILGTRGDPIILGILLCIIAGTIPITGAIVLGTIPAGAILTGGVGDIPIIGVDILMAGTIGLGTPHLPDRTIRVDMIVPMEAQAWADIVLDLPLTVTVAVV